MYTKKCCSCKEYKLLSDFHKDLSKHDKLCSQCKVCRNKTTSLHHKGYYQRSKDRLKLELSERKKVKKDKFNEWKKQFCCILCGEDEISCLDFHHLNPKIKDVSINKVISHWSWERIMTEIDKCVIVCSNCHRKIHANLITLLNNTE